jgi:hypothetical protein
MKIKDFLPYVCFTVLVTLSGIFLQHFANSIPASHVATRVSADFANSNLITHNYPFNVFGSNTIRSNIGQNQYTECAMLLSLLVPNDHNLKDAILPRTLKSANSKRCEQLFSIHKTVLSENSETIQSKHLRTRYWWGARTLYSLGLRQFNLYEVREIIRSLTSIAYVVLAVLLAVYSTRLLIVSIPLIGFGILFSGIAHYSEIILGIPYLWALIVPCGLLGLLIAGASDQKIHWWLFISGCISSFIWLLDGHLSLVFAWLALIAYFTSQQTMSFSFVKAVKKIMTYIAVFCTGFLSCYLLMQVTKGLYLGFSNVFGSISNSIEKRTSAMDYGHGELTFDSVLDVVIGIGYKTVGTLGHPLIWKIVYYSSCLALVTGIAITLFKTIKGNRTLWAGVLILLLIGLSILFRYFALQNHSAIHAFFIGRYFFITLAAMWMVLILSLLPNLNIKPNASNIEKTNS